MLSHPKNWFSCCAQMSVERVQMFTKARLVWSLIFSLTALFFSGPTLSESSPTEGYTQTRFPVVLVHGLFGFDDILGVGYWHGIPDALEEGGAQVFVAQVANAQSTEVRGEQLLSQVEEIIALTGAEKVNLIGHSHGGLTVRYVASVMPEIVASVTTIGSPNKGTKVADLIRKVPEDSVSEAALNAMVKAFALLVDYMSGGGYSQDPLAALGSLTTKGVAIFNQQHPAGLPKEPCGEGALYVEGVYYFSWGGNRILTNILDLSDPALKTSSWAFGNEDNDGLVSSCSSRLGKVIRDDFPMNHLDQSNMIAGLSSVFGTDPIAVFRSHLNRLKTLGL